MWKNIGKPSFSLKLVGRVKLTILGYTVEMLWKTSLNLWETTCYGRPNWFPEIGFSCIYFMLANFLKDNFHFQILHV